MLVVVSTIASVSLDSWNANWRILNKDNSSSNEINNVNYLSIKRIGSGKSFLIIISAYWISFRIVWRHFWTIVYQRFFLFNQIIFISTLLFKKNLDPHSLRVQQMTGIKS